MERLRVHADATTFIGLARIDLLDLLTLLRTPILVTTRVWEEVAPDSPRPGTHALRVTHAAGLLAVVDEGDPAAFPQFDAGESMVISAAAAAPSVVLLDERRARSVIVESPELQNQIVQVTGIFGLILLAKKRGHIDTARPLVDDLRRPGCRISLALYRNVLN